MQLDQKSKKSYKLIDETKTIPITLMLAYQQVRTKPKMSAHLLSYYIDTKLDNIKQMTNKEQLSIVQEELMLLKESTNLIDLHKFENIAALNVLEQMCDERYFHSIVNIYAKLYNWKWKKSDNYISKYELPEIEKDVHDTFDTIRTIDDNEYKILIGKKMSGKDITQEENNQLKKKEFLKHFKHDENSKLLFDSKNSCIKQCISSIIEQNDAEYTEIGRKFHNLKKLRGILIPTNPDNSISKLIDITKTGTIITEFNLNKLTKIDRADQRKIFGIDIDPDDIGKINTTTNSTKSAIVISAILTKMFNVELERDSKKKRWIVKSNNGIKSGLKNTMVDPSKWTF